MPRPSRLRLKTVRRDAAHPLVVGPSPSESPRPILWAAPRQWSVPRFLPGALPLQLLVDDLREVVRGHHAGDEAAVDEHRRRTVDSRLGAGLHVTLDHRRLLARIETAVEAGGVDTGDAGGL